MNKSYIYIGGGVVVALAVFLGVWYLFFSSPTAGPAGNGATFGQGSTNTTNVGANSDAGTNEPTDTTTGGGSTQKIFKISDGPVAGATLIDATRPTTTVARFVMADSGHVFDLAVDSPGAAAKTVSNATVPGIMHVAWSESGRGALVQYVDQGTLKTAHFALPGVASSTQVKVQFLQNNIASLAVSPDGINVAYLIKTANGADGYTARADGAGVKKLFSLPLSQMSLSWPSVSTLLAVSAPAAGVSGGAFTIDAKTGSTAPILFADGLSAAADRSFSRILYQIAGATRATYLLSVKSGLAASLSFDPLPEQCVFSVTNSNTMYCAAPLQYVDLNYIDQRHQGIVSPREGVFEFNLATSRAQLVATPGSDGGIVSDIEELSLSPQDTYALFIRRGDRSLWGVRLTQ